MSTPRDQFLKKKRRGLADKDTEREKKKQGRGKGLPRKGGGGKT